MSASSFKKGVTEGVRYLALLYVFTDMEVGEYKESKKRGWKWIKVLKPIW